LTDHKICILWDMDGTIIDSFDLHYESWRQALLEADVNLTRAKFKESFGRNNRISIAHYLGYEPDEALFQKLTGNKETLFRKFAADTARPFPGVIDWLSYFKEKHIKQAIASSAPPLNIEIILEAFHLNGFFCAIVPGANLPSKPAPDIFLKAAKALNCEPKDCVVIEDSSAGLLAGKAAGMVTVGVATTQAKNTIQADIILDDFQTQPDAFLDQISNFIQ
jgi:beta-phosphoglucomutase